MTAQTKTRNQVFTSPMLARRVRQLPEGSRWQYEVKWDGYRMLAFKDGKHVRLLSRNAGDYTARFPEVAQAIGRLKSRAVVLDGEVVAVDEQGRPSFQALQNGARPSEGWAIVYYVFDVLRWNRKDLLRLPLAQRRGILEQIVKGSGIRLSPVLEAAAADVIKQVRKLGLEGVVAKRLDSFYEPGARSGAWVKVPLKQSREFVIGGFRPSPGSLDLLLVGYFEGRRGEFRFAGKVRQGLNPALRQLLLGRLKPLVIRACPFADLPNSKTDHFGETVTAEEMSSYVWTRPRLVTKVKYTEWTSAHVLRHAEFAGLTEMPQLKMGQQGG